MSSPNSGVQDSTADSRIPLSTHVMLISIMVFFFSATTVFTLQGNWAWWLIPLVPLLIVTGIIVTRINKVLQRRALAAAQHPKSDQ